MNVNQQNLYFIDAWGTYCTVENYSHLFWKLFCIFEVACPVPVHALRVYFRVGPLSIFLFLATDNSFFNKSYVQKKMLQVFYWYIDDWKFA